MEYHEHQVIIYVRATDGRVGCISGVLNFEERDDLEALMSGWGVPVEKATAQDLEGAEIVAVKDIDAALIAEHDQIQAYVKDEMEKALGKEDEPNGTVIAVRPDVNAVFVNIGLGEIRAIRISQYPSLANANVGDVISYMNFENHPTSQF